MSTACTSEGQRGSRVGLSAAQPLPSLREEAEGQDRVHTKHTNIHTNVS